MKYKYYKLYRDIYRIPKNFSKITSYKRVEIYYNNEWQSSIRHYYFLEKTGKKLTKDEAFMEML